MTSKQRKQIRAMAGAGITEAQIAKALSIPIDDVRAVSKTKAPVPEPTRKEPRPIAPAPAPAPRNPLARHSTPFTDRALIAITGHRPRLRGASPGADLMSDAWRRAAANTKRTI